MDSSGLEASAPRILSTPMDGSVFHGERNVTPGYGQVVSEVWTPTKPWDYYYVRIGINAKGYGEVAFTLNGNTRDSDIGSWRSEPLRKANRNPFTFEKRYNTNIINEARQGFADEISPVTVSMPATGSAQTRSRSIVTYGSRQAAINAQAGTTGPSVGFVIGTSTFWKWEAGLTRTVSADNYNGSYSVTINDTNIDPGSGSSSGCANKPGPNYCNDQGSCSVGSGSGVPGPICGHNYCCCSPTRSTPPSGSNPPSGGSTPPSGSTTLACGHSSSASGDHSLQATCSSSNSNGNCTVTNFYACQSHTHVYPTPPPAPPPPSSSTTCAAEHSYNPDSTYAVNYHRTRTCRRSGCSNSWQACVTGWTAPRCSARPGSGCWAQ